jgi:formylglycine-generating enzyme required for sulfatase activity
LKKQLAGLFTGLNENPPTDRSVSLTPASEGDIERYLAALFSDLDAPAETDEAVIEGQLVSGSEVTRVELLPPPPAPIDDIIKLLKSKEPEDRCRAITSLAEMPSDWTIDPLLYASRDPDDEVSDLALETLLRIAEQVNNRILALANHPSTSPLHQGATIYISYLIGQPFVYIPSGAFLMGSDPTVDPLVTPPEQPQHQLVLPSYWISRYPVTAIQFQLYLNESRSHLRGGRKYGQDDYPVVDVTWLEARAYCNWLSEAAGLPISLPSEAEWEKAARGTDGRRYPWGNQSPTDELCNFHSATPVGHYSPQGDSPYGCADMTGNVWEWTRSLYKAYPYDPEDGREIIESDQPRAVRGLTFNNREELSRCAYRHSLAPMLHLNTLGFRLAISPTFAI